MGGSFSMIFMLILLGGMFFFMTRSQKKQQQQRETLLDSMKPGDKAVTIGGLHGVISEINTASKTVTLDCEGIYLEFDRASIRTVTPGTVVNTSTAETVTEEVKPVEPEEPVEVKEETVITTENPESEKKD